MAASKMKGVLNVSRGPNFGDEKVMQFRDMMMKDVLTDYVIHVKEEKIKCHKMILAEASPFFNAIFTLKKDDSDLEEIRMDGLHVRAVRDLVQYCYIGELENVPISLVKEYLVVVKLFQLMELYEKFDTFLVENMEEASCLKFFSYANRFDLSKSRDAAMNTILSSLSDVKNMPELNELSVDEVSAIMTAGSSNAENKENLFQMSINYLTSDEKRGKQIDTFVNVLVDSCLNDYVGEFRERYQSSISSLDDSCVKVMKNLDYSDKSDELSYLRGRRIMVYGGVRKDESLVNKVFMLDLVTGESEEILQAFVRFGSAICETKHGLLVVGGLTSMDAATCQLINKCDLLNLSTLTWTHFPDPLSKVYFSGAASMQEAVFLVGGSKRENRMDCLDTLNRKWSRCPDLLEEVNEPIVVVIESFLLVVSNIKEGNSKGRIGNAIVLQCYDTTNKSWSLRSPLPQAVTETFGASAVSSGQKMFLVGGKQRMFLSYELPCDTWSSLTRPAQDHWFGSSIQAGNRIIVCGGLHDGRMDDIEIYDLQSEKWSMSKVKLPVPVWHLFCCELK